MIKKRNFQKKTPLSLHPYPLPSAYTVRELGENVEPQVITVIGLACGYYSQQIWRTVSTERFRTFPLCFLTDIKKVRDHWSLVISFHLLYCNPALINIKILRILHK